MDTDSLPGNFGEASFDEGCRQLLSDLCHEVRTPLNGILGTLELVLASDVSEEVRELVREVYESTVGLHDVFENGVGSMYDHLSELPAMSKMLSADGGRRSA